MSGVVSDSVTQEVLVGATVYALKDSLGTSTNEYGHFTLKLTREQAFQISYVGYRKQLVSSSEESMTIFLRPDNEIAVTISDNLNNSINAPALRLASSTLTSIPTLGGEPDIIKSLSSYPGMSIGQEGSSKLYVRGGTPDQNLMLLDGITVYNANHLGGFFSVFNPESINNVDVYKSKFPARYGGRLSSVIDITGKEGNSEEYKGKIGIGLLSTHLKYEGPLKKDKSNFIVTGRSSYLGLINLFRDRETADNFLDYWLYDLNVKTTFDVANGKLFFSYYTGSDFSTNRGNSRSFSSGQVLGRSFSEQSVTWGNQTLSARYVRSMGKSIFWKSIVGYTGYRFNSSFEETELTFNSQDTISNYSRAANNSIINDLIAKTEFEYTPSSKTYLKTGLFYVHHNFQVGSDNLDLPNLTSDISSDELNYYVESTIDLNKRIRFSSGLRGVQYFVDGEMYGGFEPRVTLDYFVKNTSIFLNYSRNRQFLHLLNDISSGLPVDVWVPVTKDVAPQYADQFSLGTQTKVSEKIYIEIDIYYKYLRNLIDFRSDILDPFSVIGNWQNVIETSGKGRSYGSEFLLKMNDGKFHGFLGYTLSWTNREFESINLGNPYPFTFDRRHDLSLNLNYKLNSKINLFLNWIYQSGIAITLPVAFIPDQNGEGFLSVYSDKNNGRMPSFHRMDLGLEYSRKLRNDNMLTWNFSLYNAYNRNNPNGIDVGSQPLFNSSGEYLFQQPVIFQQSFFPIIPGISLNYSF